MACLKSYSFKIFVSNNDGKVDILWESYKNLKNIPYFFTLQSQNKVRDIFLFSFCYSNNIWTLFSGFSWTRQIIRPEIIQQLPTIKRANFIPNLGTYWFHFLGAFHLQNADELRNNTMRTNLLNWCNLVSISNNAVFYAFLMVRIY